MCTIIYLIIRLIILKNDFSCISIDTSIYTNKFNYELSNKYTYY